MTEDADKQISDKPEEALVPAWRGSDGIPETVTETDYSVELRAKALDLYLTTTMTPEEIGILLGVPAHVCMLWASEDNWAYKKRRQTLLALVQAEKKYRDTVFEHQVQTLKRHVDMSVEAESLIVDLLRKLREEATKNPSNRNIIMDLRRLTEAMASATAVSARAVAIGERMLVGQGGGEDDDGSGRGRKGVKPALVFNINPTLAPGPQARQPKTITITGEGPIQVQKAGEGKVSEPIPVEEEPIVPVPDEDGEEEEGELS